MSTTGQNTRTDSLPWPNMRVLNETDKPVTEIKENIPIKQTVIVKRPILERPDESRETMIARLTYQSRKRGILETDLLLSTFASIYLPTFDKAMLSEFEHILEEYDWDVYYWMTEKKTPPRRFAESPVLKLLVEHAKNKGKQMLRMPDLSPSSS